jgi:hypothetical protein
MTAVEQFFQDLVHLGYIEYPNENLLQDRLNLALEIERDQLILFGAQCMVETEKESGLGAIKIYELYFDKTFKSDKI